MSEKNGYDPEELSDQERTFVAELAADMNFNATEAARKAGYAEPKQAAYRLMQRERVQLAIGEARRERMERTKIQADEILLYLRGGLTLNPLKLFEAGANGEWVIKDIGQIPESFGPFIERISTTKDGVSVRFVSKTKFCDLAMRHLGLFKPQQIDVQTGGKSFSWNKLFDPRTIEEIRREQEATDEIEIAIESVGAPAELSEDEKLEWARKRVWDRVYAKPAPPGVPGYNSDAEELQEARKPDHRPIGQILEDEEAGFNLLDQLNSDD